MSDFATERFELQKDRIKIIEQEIALGTSHGKTLSYQELSSRRGSLKAMKLDLVKMGNAVCTHLIEEIKKQIETAGGQLSDDRKMKLGKTNVETLSKLSVEVATLQASSEQIKLIDSSIADFEQSQTDTEKK